MLVTELLEKERCIENSVQHKTSSNSLLSELILLNLSRTQEGPGPRQDKQSTAIPKISHMLKSTHVA